MSLLWGGNQSLNNVLEETNTKYLTLFASVESIETDQGIVQRKASARIWKFETIMFKAENRVEVNQAESQVMMLDEDFDKSGTN